MVLSLCNLLASSTVVSYSLVSVFLWSVLTPCFMQAGGFCAAVWVKDCRSLAPRLSERVVMAKVYWFSEEIQSLLFCAVYCLPTLGFLPFRILFILFHFRCLYSFLRTVVYVCFPCHSPVLETFMWWEAVRSDDDD